MVDLKHRHFYEVERDTLRPMVAAGKARQADRKRKMEAITLSDEARAKLAVLAEAWGMAKSRVVEELIMDASVKP